MKKTNVIIFSIFTALISGFAGYEMGGYKDNTVNKIRHEFHDSTKNINIILHIKTLRKLKDNEVKDAIERHEKLISMMLKNNKIEKETLTFAKEYQNKYCLNKCLGV